MAGNCPLCPFCRQVSSKRVYLLPGSCEAKNSRSRMCLAGTVVGLSREGQGRGSVPMAALLLTGSGVTQKLASAAEPAGAWLVLVWAVWEMSSRWRQGFRTCASKHWVQLYCSFPSGESICTGLYNWRVRFEGPVLPFAEPSIPSEASARVCVHLLNNSQYTREEYGSVIRHRMYRLLVIWKSNFAPAPRECQLVSFGRLALPFML